MVKQQGGFAGALASAKPLTTSIRLCLDGQLLAEANQVAQAYLQAKVDDEQSNTPDRAPALGEQLRALQERISAAEVEFVFRSIGRLAWRNLVAEHPPTKEQREQTFADFNVDTFPVAAVAASCVAPEGVTVEGVEELAEILSEGQWNRLWATCHAANTAGGESPNLGAAFAPARPTATS
ncbi:MAG: hypothetical protein ACXVW0_07565 [Nocardioides sp.]